MNDDADRRIAAHYAPPRNVPPAHFAHVEPYVPRDDVRSPFIKWIYAGAALTAFMAEVTTNVLPFPAQARALFMLFVGLVGMAKAIVGLVWLYNTWKELPPAYLREIKETPGNVVVMLFVPFYNFYWAFASQSRLCTGIDTLLARVHKPPRAPRHLAFLAPALQVVGTAMRLTKDPLIVLIGTTASSAGWIAFMFACDRSLREMHRALSRREY